MWQRTQCNNDTKTRKLSSQTENCRSLRLIFTEFLGGDRVVATVSSERGLLYSFVHCLHEDIGSVISHPTMSTTFETPLTSKLTSISVMRLIQLAAIVRKVNAIV